MMHRDKMISTKSELHWNNITSIMIRSCSGGQNFSLSATLENPIPEGTAFARDHTCNGSGSNGTVTRYGKNYAITNQAL